MSNRINLSHFHVQVAEALVNSCARAAAAACVALACLRHLFARLDATAANCQRFASVRIYCILFIVCIYCSLLLVCIYCSLLLACIYCSLLLVCIDCSLLLVCIYCSLLLVCIYCSLLLHFTFSSTPRAIEGPVHDSNGPHHNAVQPTTPIQPSCRGRSSSRPAAAAPAQACCPAQCCSRRAAAAFSLSAPPLLTCKTLAKISFHAEFTALNCTRASSASWQLAQ
jgi:hypothetical protein